MSFLNRQNPLKKINKIQFTSLQANPHINKIYPRILMISDSRRASLFPFCRLEGSITVEGSFVLSFFLFAMMNLLSLLLGFGEYSSNLSNLQQQGKELAITAHITEDGINVHNDMIMLTKVQDLKPMVPFIGYEPAKTIANCRVRKWTGYDVTGNGTFRKEEEWVYITPYGDCYHRNRECSYIKLSLKSASLEKIKNLSNKQGARYTPCEVCGSNTYTGIVFYTEQGDRYHTSLQCSGIKRSIESVPISKVGNRTPCSRCKEG